MTSIVNLKNFRLEVYNICASYNTPHAEKLAIVKNGLTGYTSNT